MGSDCDASLQARPSSCYLVGKINSRKLQGCLNEIFVGAKVAAGKSLSLSL